MTPDQYYDCRNELARILLQCTEHGIRLAAALEEERAAYSDSDATRLLELIEHKQQLVRQMEDLETKRRNLCHRLGFDADEDGMHRLLERTGDDGDLGELWSRLLRCARDAEKSNRTNGAIARARQEQTVAILAALHGSAEAQPTYSDRGQRSPRFQNNPLTRA